MLAAKNYPATPIVGTQIRALEIAAARSCVLLTQAGTRCEGEKLPSSGRERAEYNGAPASVTKAQQKLMRRWIDRLARRLRRRDTDWREALAGVTYKTGFDLVRDLTR